MSKIICVTNRKLCKADEQGQEVCFLEKIERLCRSGVHAVILREKDLSESDYKKLALKVFEICKRYNTTFIPHTYEIEGCNVLHLPLALLRGRTGTGTRVARCERGSNACVNQIKIGTSVHSVEDAIEAELLGATYLVAGHIFETDCKKGLTPRGLDFLRQVCEAVNIPVYAIGGIAQDNFKDVLACGASGGAIMSSAMLCEDEEKFLHAF